MRKLPVMILSSILSLNATAIECYKYNGGNTNLTDVIQLLNDDVRSVASEMGDYEVLMAGDQYDQIICKQGRDTEYKPEIFSIEARLYKDEDRARIFSDGAQVASCKTNKLELKSDNYKPALNLDLDLLGKLSVSEIYQVLSQSGIGTCQVWGENLQVSNRSVNSDTQKYFKSKLVDAQIHLDKDEIDKAVVVQVVMDMAHDGKCGVDNAEKSSETTRKTLARLGLGIKLLSTEGKTNEELKELGYSSKAFKEGLELSFSEIVDLGFTLKGMINEFTVDELKTHFTIDDYVNSSIGTSHLLAAGHNAQALKDAGHDIETLKNEKGYSLQSLNTLGFSIQDFKEGGVKLSEIRSARNNDYNRTTSFPDSELKAHFTIEQFRGENVSWTSLSQIGYTLEEMKTAGASLVDFRDARNNDYNRTRTFTDSSLQELYKVGEFKSAGVSLAGLNTMGYSLDDIVATGSSLAELRSARRNDYNRTRPFSDSDLTKHFSITDFRAERISWAGLKSLGYSLSKMKEEGASLAELRDAKNNDYNRTRSFSDTELKNHFSIEQFRDENVSWTGLNQIGYTLEEMKTAGASLVDFRSARNHDYNRTRTFSDSSLQDLYQIDDFKSAGVSLSGLSSMGYSLSDVVATGSSLSELRASKNNDYNRTRTYTDTDLTKHFKISDFRNENVSWGSLKNLGYSLSAIKAEGASLSELRNARNNDYSRSRSFTDSELRDLYSIEEFRSEGIAWRSLRQMGFSIDELQAAGANDSDL